MFKKFVGVFIAAAGIVALSGAAAGQEAAASSSVKAALKKNVLTVTGTPGPDSITLRLRAGDPNTLEIDVGANGTADFAFDRTKFTTVVVNGGGGADTLAADASNGTFTGTEQTTLDGGDGPDTLRGEVGGEDLRGSAGDDFIDGNLGVDTIAAGDGNDVVQWDPGDGNDTIVGGTGSDRLLFNAANIGEKIDLSAAAAGHVRLFRDVANITLDLDDVEVVDLHLFGGADTVTVNSLFGTDVTEVRADVAAFGGGDDTQIDIIVVPPSVSVGSDGSAAVVDGLGPRVRVVGASQNDEIHITGPGAADVVTVAGTAGPDTVNAFANGTDVSVIGATGSASLRLTTVELMKVALGAGADTFSAVGNLAALVLIDVDGGDGADTILGGNGADVLNGGNGDDFVDGQQGIDTVQLGEGNDVVQWDPGDGNDTIVGGTGADRLAVNGSNGSENIDLSATAGGHVRLARDLGGIVLDVDDVEVVDLGTFGGTDNVTVNNLVGTNVTEVRTDLAPFGGGDDGMVDSVIVAPGVTLGSDGAAAVIDGLGARIRVLGGSASDQIHVTGPGAVDVVTVVGTSGPDSVNVTANGTDATVWDATPGVHLRLTTVELLKVAFGGGDDTFTAVGNLAALIAFDVDGGDGADTILGSNGADILRGGNGDDFVDGQQGIDTVQLGDGNDVVQWDPGDGSDIIVGGTGADRLAFHASNASENIDLSATAGGEVRLFRDLAAITLDLDDIEVLDLHLFGGTDSLTVNDLAGTDLTEVRTDLALQGGGDDGQIDSIVVNGGGGDDTVTVVHDGSAVIAKGLAATVRIGGANPSADRLTVNGLAGNDNLTSTPEANAAIIVALVQ